MTRPEVRFLLVEDDDSHALLFTRVLHRFLGATRIDRVGDGVEALAYLRQEGQYNDRPRPDVVFLDLKLPRLDGLEALEQIKNDPSLLAIPIVMLTTSDAESDRATAYARHVNSYVLKPADFEQFQHMVRDLGFYWGTWNCRPQ
ncbi:MAG: response regulator [Bryobacterales bacterium]